MANDFDVQIKWLNGSQIEVQASDVGSLTGAEKVLIMDGASAKETTTQDIANLGGGGVIPDTAYASNADAVAGGLVAGDLYKCSVKFNGSYPILMVT